MKHLKLFNEGYNDEYYTEVKPIIWDNILRSAISIDDEHKKKLDKLLSNFKTSSGTLPVGYDVHPEEGYSYVQIYKFYSGYDNYHIIQCKDEWWVLWRRNFEENKHIKDNVWKCDQYDGLLELLNYLEDI